MRRVKEIRGWQLVKLLRALNEREGPGQRGGF